MGARELIAIGMLAASAGAAHADHYDDLGIRVEVPGDGALKEDGKQVSGITHVDGVEVDVSVILVDEKDWSPKNEVEMMLAAQSLPGDGGKEVKESFRTIRSHTVAGIVWDANDKDIRFDSVLFPTAKGLYIASWSTSKADFDKTKAWRTAFFRAGISFDGGPPGEEMPHSDLRDRVTTAATGPAGFAQVADAKVKVTFTDTKKSKQLARAKIDQAAWDADLAPLFTELNANGDVDCRDDKMRCWLDDPYGPPVEYRFKKAKGGALLIEIRTTSK